MTVKRDAFCVRRGTLKPGCIHEPSLASAPGWVLHRVLLLPSPRIPLAQFCGPVVSGFRGSVAGGELVWLGSKKVWCDWDNFCCPLGFSSLISQVGVPKPAWEHQTQELKITIVQCW